MIEVNVNVIVGDEFRDLFDFVHETLETKRRDTGSLTEFDNLSNHLPGVVVRNRSDLHVTNSDAIFIKVKSYLTRTTASIHGLTNEPRNDPGDDVSDEPDLARVGRDDVEDDEGPWDEQGDEEFEPEWSRIGGDTAAEPRHEERDSRKEQGEE